MYGTVSVLLWGVMWYKKGIVEGILILEICWDICLVVMASEHVQWLSGHMGYVIALWIWEQKNILSRISVTKDGIWIGNWIYWPLTAPNYK
jgi:hypothetical protein